MTLTTLTLLAWYASGVYSFIYWWTAEFDFTIEHLPFAVVIGGLGPIAWLLGRNIHGKENHRPTVIIKRKRTTNE